MLSSDPVTVQDLADLDLPEPSAITDAAKQAERDSSLSKLNTDLSKLPLKDPSAITSGDDEEDEREAQEALQEAISGLSLPMPEHVMRANMRADGTKTPEPVYVHFDLLVLGQFQI